MTGSCPRGRLASYLYQRYGLCKLQAGFERLVNALGSEPSNNLDQLDPLLVAASTNGETHFLRHHEQFEWLQNEWLPPLLQGPPRNLRVLSAGCSSGEEPYSLAATLRPKIPLGDGWGLSVDAFDINPQSLQAARVGRYGMWSMRGVSLPEVSHWVRQNGNGVCVADWVKGSVRFFVHNLLEPMSPVAPYDLIFCRNVLIYFHDQAVRTTYTNLARLLSPAGFLVSGPSDPGPGTGCGLALQWQDGTRIYRPENGPLQRPQPAHPSRQVRPTTTLRLPPSYKPSSPRELARCRTSVSFARPPAVPPQGGSLNAATFCMEAVQALESGRMEEAVLNARRAVFLRPDQVYPVYLLGLVLERLGEMTGARLRFHRSLELLERFGHGELLEYADGLTAGRLKEVLDARAVL